MKQFSRWQLAKIKATLENNPYDQEDTEAKLEIQRDIDGNYSNVLAEALDEPKFWDILKAYFTL